MAKTNTKRSNWLKKKIRTKKSLGALGKYPRLVVFRSNKHTYCQLIDDNTATTILSASTKDKDLQKQIISAKNKVDQSKIVGDSMSEKVKKSKIKKIIYDRNGYRYHGRVKALAEAIREKGVKF